jgi:hypothetical protein
MKKIALPKITLDWDDVLIPVGMIAVAIGLGMFALWLGVVAGGVECAAFGILMGRST